MSLGVIPSILFEFQTSDEEFSQWLDQMFETLDGDKGVILGIGDQAIGPTNTDRIKYVSDLLNGMLR